MNKALEGIKVVDFCLAGAGPSCTKILAEYGADVIWVEPLAGASTRSVFKLDFYTTGKKSITLNLKTEEGKEVMYKLVKDADVFVSNYRTRAVKKLGLGYEELSKLNPRLIYATLTGYGDEGPEKDSPGYDTVAFWARGGMLVDIAEKGEIVVPPIALGDIAAGQALVGGICAALYQREKTGKGDWVFTSLLAEAVYLNHDALIECQYGEEYPKSRKSPRRSLLNTYRCSDGKWICLAVPEDFDRYFWKILEKVGRADLVGDPRWTCMEDTMYDKAPEVVAILDEAFGKMTQDEAVAAMESIDAPVSRVQHTVDLLTDPQVIENNFTFKLEASTPPNEDTKEIVVPANPLKFTNKDSGVIGRTRGPRLGEHSVEVLKKYGYSDEEIEDMISKKITSKPEE